MNVPAFFVGWVGLTVCVSAQVRLPELEEYRPTQVNSRSGTSLTYTTARSSRTSDFVPARCLLVADNFQEDAVGYFPARWRTNSVGEVVTLEGISGHWLTLNQPGHFMPDSVGTLPDEFTLQFDLVCTNPYNFYSTGFHTTFASLKNPATDYPRPEQADGSVGLMLHPMDVSGQRGYSELNVVVNRQRQPHRETKIDSFWAKERNAVTVSIWRQQQRLRVYVDAEKIWDVPTAFQPALPYNALIFGVGTTHRDPDSFYLSNLRLSANQ
jgi:OmpA-OmpF porin, OOP family